MWFYPLRKYPSAGAPWRATALDRWGRGPRGAGVLLGLGLLLTSLSCAPESTRVIVVSLNKLESVAPLTAVLRVSTTLDQRLTRAQDLPVQPRFGLRVPTVWEGSLGISVQALSAARCLLAEGSASDRLPGADAQDPVLNVLVGLSDQIDAGCRLSVVVPESSLGGVESQPAGILCGTVGARCSALFLPGAPVRLAVRTSNLFAGWEGACSGTQPTCEVSLMERALQVVSARFSPLCDGQWCVAPQLPPGLEAVTLRGVHGALDGALWLVGDGGAVLRLPGSGAADVSFAALPSMSKSDLSAVHSSEPGNVWMVGRGGAVLRWDGTTLSPVVSAVASDLRGVYVMDTRTTFAVGAGGVALRWDGLVPAVVPVDGGATRELTAVHGARDEVWAVSADGAALRYDGARFAVQPGLAARSLQTVLVRSPREVWVGGARLLRWDGQSARDFAIPAGIPGALLGSTALPSGDLWFVGEQGLRAWVTAAGELRVYSDANGAQRLSQALLSVTGAGGYVWAAGERGTLLRAPAP